MLANDEYVMDVCTELEYNQKQYILLLKRTVWIHPLRLDNALYIDAMFFQVIYLFFSLSFSPSLPFSNLLNNLNYLN